MKYIAVAFIAFTNSTGMQYDSYERVHTNTDKSFCEAFLEEGGWADGIVESFVNKGWRVVIEPTCNQIRK